MRARAIDYASEEAAFQGKGRVCMGWASQGDIPDYIGRRIMRYLVKARVKAGRERALLQAIKDGTLGKGSVAGDEYLYDMEQARVAGDGTAHWVETCFCATPLQEERPYWEEFFELVSVKDAHSRRNCRDANGTEPWACTNCDCTKRLEERLRKSGDPFLEILREKDLRDEK
jgi:hypothetical protein